MFSAPPATAASASPEHDRLGRRDDRLQAAAAQPVQRQRRRLDRQAALDARHPGQVMIVRVGVDDVAEDDVADLARLDAGAADGFAHAFGRQFARRDILQSCRHSRRSPSARRSGRRLRVTLRHLLRGKSLKKPTKNPVRPQRLRPNGVN